MSLQLSCAHTSYRMNEENISLGPPPSSSRPCPSSSVPPTLSSSPAACTPSSPCASRIVPSSSVVYELIGGGRLLHISSISQLQHYSRPPRTEDEAHAGTSSPSFPSISHPIARRCDATLCDSISLAFSLINLFGQDEVAWEKGREARVCWIARTSLGPRGIWRVSPSQSIWIDCICQRLACQSHSILLEALSHHHSFTAAILSQHRLLPHVLQTLASNFATQRPYVEPLLR